MISSGLDKYTEHYNAADLVSSAPTKYPWVAADVYGFCFFGPRETEYKLTNAGYNSRSVRIELFFKLGGPSLHEMEKVKM